MYLTETRYYEFAEYLLDRETGVLYRHGDPNPVGLRPKSSQVLCHLIDRRPVVVSKDELSHAIWGARSAEENYIKGTILDIRRTLLCDDENPRFIKALRGVGYQFICPVNEISEAEAREKLSPANITPLLQVTVNETEVTSDVTEPAPADVATALSSDDPPPHPNSRHYFRAAIIASFSVVTVLATVLLITLLQKPIEDKPDPLPLAIQKVAVWVAPSGDEIATQRLASGIGRAVRQDLASDQRIREHDIEIVEADVPQPGEELRTVRRLKADAGVEVSVRTTPNRIHYTARVISGANGSELWKAKSLSLARKEAKVEASISRSLVQDIVSKLTGENDETHREHLQKDKSESAYQRGGFHLSQRTPEQLRRAVTEFEEAIRINPENARAHAGRADCYALLGGFGYNEISPQEAYREANASVMKALEADPNLSEAHATAGLIAFMYEQNWEKASIELKEAIRIKKDSNLEYPAARHLYANLLTTQGRFPEAIAQIDAAYNADSASRIIGAGRGWILYFMGDYDDAIAKCNEALNLDLNFYAAHAFLGFVYLQKQDYTGAIEELKEARRLSKDSPVATAYLGYAYGLSGNTAQALKSLSALEAAQSRRYVSPYCFAILHTALGQKDKAIEYLERLKGEHSPWLLHLGIEPMLDPLRDDRRFDDLAASVGIRPEVLARSRMRAAKAAGLPRQ